MTNEQQQPPPISPSGRRVFRIMAIAMLAAGALLLLFPGWLGADRGTGALIGGAFLLVGAVDLLILKNWSKIFAPRPDSSGSSRD